MWCSDRSMFQLCQSLEHLYNVKQGERRVNDTEKKQTQMFSNYTVHKYINYLAYKRFHVQWRKYRKKYYLYNIEQEGCFSIYTWLFMTSRNIPFKKNKNGCSTITKLHIILRIKEYVIHANVWVIWSKRETFTETILMFSEISLYSLGVCTVWEFVQFQMCATMQTVFILKV